VDRTLSSRGVSTGDDNLCSLESLFRRYREHGDASAIAEVYDRSAIRLLSLATHLCSNASEAEDAVQATFLAALDRAHEWDAERPLLPWLIGILTNRVRRQRRDGSRRVDADRLRSNTVDDPPSALCQAEFTRAVDEAISRLPRAYQPVLVLRLKHDMEPADIAHALRRPPGTVRAQLSRGLELLRRFLPPVFAGLLAVYAVPTRGLAAVREIVLERAGAIAEATNGTLATAGMRRATWFALATASMLFAIWLGWSPALAAPMPAPITSETAAAAGGLVAADAVDAGSAFEREGVFDERVAAVSTGDLRVDLSFAGRPAAQALVRLEPLGATSAHFVRRVQDRYGVRTVREAPSGGAGREALCDIAGVVRFANLPAGYWLVHVPDVSGIVHVQRGEQVTVRRALERSCVEVHGFVHDANGEPLAGAPIWATRTVGVDIVQSLLQTDASGCFRTYQPRGAILAARPIGLQAHAVRLNAVATTATLHFPCAPDGGAVEGTVTDAAGRPVVDTVVQVGDAWDLWTRREDATHSVLSGVPASLRTDGRGRFRLDALTPGSLRVRAGGGPMVSTVVDVAVTADRTAVVDIGVAAGASVRGTVVDAEGRPAACERVRWTACGSGDERSTATDAEGRFELRGLPPQAVVVTAGTGPAGFARRSLTLASGTNAEWNAVLSPDADRIAGRVVDADGRPGRFLVVLESPRQVVATAVDGTFAFRVPDFRIEHLAAVHVYDAGALDEQAVARRPALVTRTGLTAGTLDVELRVPAVARTAAVRGEVVVDDAADLGGLHLVAEHWTDRVAVGATVERVATPTRWSCADLPPGRYRLLLEHRQVACFELAEGQQLDLGALVAGVRGPRVVAVERPDAALKLFAFVPPARTDRRDLLLVDVVDPARGSLSRHAAVWRDGAWTMALSLPNGSYRIDAATEDGLSASTSLVVSELRADPHAVRVPLARR